MKTFKLTFIFLLLLIAKQSFAQMSEEGVPPSFLNKALPKSVAIETMPRVNADSLINADAAESKIDRPYRFGYAIDVNLNLYNCGTWDTLENGDKLWRLKIFSENAYSINLIFDNFWLPESAKLFIYNEDESMILGAFTARTSNNESNMFATDLIQGNTIVLEYYEPAYSQRGIINIGMVIHAYRDMFNNRGLGNSGNCNIDVMCPLGDDWCVERHAVSQILVNNNTAICTGCLINNVRQDLTPYYLTANHCFFNDNGIQTTNPTTCIFRFGYWRPRCDSGRPSGHKSFTGADLKAHHAGSDFTLLKLTQQPESEQGIFYAGWDNTNIPAQNATAIHHPSGDAMKISHDADLIIAISWFGGPQNHWRTTFDQGVVEHVSSGSPLFNQNHRIIGQLHGNQNYNPYLTYCKQPIGEYGRFDVSWSGGGTSSTRLKDWLDPDETGTYILDGIYTCEGNKSISKTYKSGSNNTEESCRITISNTTIQSGATVKFHAKDRIVINPDTYMRDGSHVLFEIDVCGIWNKSGSNFYYSNETDGDLYNNIEETALLQTDFTESNFRNAEIKLIPNPNSGTFQLETNFPLSDITHLKITNMLGISVYETQNLTTNSIQLQNAANGLYFVVAMLKDGNLLAQKMMVGR